MATPIPATAAAPAAAPPTLRAFDIPDDMLLPTFSPALDAPALAPASCLSSSFWKFFAEGTTLTKPTPSSTAPDPNPPTAIPAPFGRRMNPLCDTESDAVLFG